MLKFAHNTEATPTAGRFTPGAFTNQIQTAFREPRLLIVTDPLTDHQPVTEASYVNIPVIAFCNTDSPLKFVDIAIPCNNKSPHSIGLMWWLLAREVLRLRGKITQDKWEIKPDLFFYRDPEEAEKEQAAIEALDPPAKDQYPDEPIVVDKTNWAGDDAALPAVAAAVVATVSTPAAMPQLMQADDWNEDDPAAVAGSWGGGGGF